ncbi:MAG: AP2 domain-containing protein [Eubacteriales bacterium]
MSLCDCGNEKIVGAKNFKYGKVKSCGCLQDKSRKKSIKKALNIRQDKYVDGTDIYQLAQEPRSNNTSGVVGVNYDKSKKTWKAKIEFKKKKYYLGSYKNKEEAIKMRKEAEEEIHGEFLKWYEKQKNKNNK